MLRFCTFGSGKYGRQFQHPLPKLLCGSYACAHPPGTDGCLLPCAYHVDAIRSKAVICPSLSMDKGRAVPAGSTSLFGLALATTSLFSWRTIIPMPEFNDSCQVLRRAPQFTTLDESKHLLAPAPWVFNRDISDNVVEFSVSGYFSKS